MGSTLHKMQTTTWLTNVFLGSWSLILRTGCSLLASFTPACNLPFETAPPDHYNESLLRSTTATLVIITFNGESRPHGPTVLPTISCSRRLLNTGTADPDVLLIPAHAAPTCHSHVVTTLQCSMQVGWTKHAGPPEAPCAGLLELQELPKKTPFPIQAQWTALAYLRGQYDALPISLANKLHGLNYVLLSVVRICRSGLDDAENHALSISCIGEPANIVLSSDALRYLTCLQPAINILAH